MSELQIPVSRAWVPKAGLDAIRALMLGTAIGDAFGSAVEQGSKMPPAATRDASRERTHITGPLPRAKGWPSGGVSSETLQLLFACEGMIRTLVRGLVNGKQPVMGTMLRMALIRWHLAQIDPAAHARPDGGGVGIDGWLAAEPLSRARRSPQATAHTALAGLRRGGDIMRSADNNSKGAGVLTRSMALGFLHLDPTAPPSDYELDAIRTEAQHLAAATHGHPEAQAAAAAVALTVHGLLRGHDLKDAALQGGVGACPLPSGESVNAAVRTALSYVGQEPPEPSWKLPTATAVYATAVHAVASGDDFEGAIRLAARHPSAPGACSALAGGLAGARSGIWQIPGDWLASLECRGLIEQVADDLLPVIGLTDGRPWIERVHKLAGRYPGV